MPYIVGGVSILPLPVVGQVAQNFLVRRLHNRQTQPCEKCGVAAGTGGAEVGWRLARVPWALAAVLPCADAATDPGRLSAQETAVATVLLNDRDVLMALYHATGGPDWDHSGSWLTDRPIGWWSGVTTDSAGRVKTLHLRDNDLRGPIPPEIGNLAAPSWLNLSDNDLSGPIPPEIGNLVSLRILAIGDNELDGSIPSEIGNLASLWELHLPFSGLRGPIPPEMANLTALRSLDFGGWGGLDLCAADSPRLLAWLATLSVNLPLCEGGG